MARSFSEYSNGGGGGDRSLCPRCRENPKAGAVNIRLHEFDEDASSRYKQVASRQVSMCEDCSVEVYEQLVDTINKETGGGTRAARAGSKVPKNEPAVPRRRRRRTTA